MLAIDLTGKKGLVLGIADARSIAYGCAHAFHAAGAELAITYLNTKAEPHVRPLAQECGAPLIMPCDVQDDTQVNAVFEAIAQTWGRLDFLLHSIAYAPKADLQGRVADSSREGFAKAMDISCHSFIRLAKCAEPLMGTGGSLMTVTYMGGEEVVEHYGLMGPVKAALESATRYLAAELGAKRIRVNALSPGPIFTRATGGIAGFGDILAASQAKAPLHSTVNQDDVGYMAAYLASDFAKNITGEVLYIDAGYKMMD